MHKSQLSHMLHHPPQHKHCHPDGLCHPRNPLHSVKRKSIVSGTVPVLMECVTTFFLFSSSNCGSRKKDHYEDDLYYSGLSQCGE